MLRQPHPPLKSLLFRVTWLERKEQSHGGSEEGSISTGGVYSQQLAVRQKFGTYQKAATRSDSGEGRGRGGRSCSLSPQKRIGHRLFNESGDRVMVRGWRALYHSQLSLNHILTLPSFTLTHSQTHYHSTIVLQIQTFHKPCSHICLVLETVIKILGGWKLITQFLLMMNLSDKRYQ